MGSRAFFYCFVQVLPFLQDFKNPLRLLCNFLQISKPKKLPTYQFRQLYICASAFPNVSLRFDRKGRMASLTPGLLSKLLENVGNKDVKVTGEHRSPLLQVIEIVPSLAEDPWHSNGFFLKLSDSLHAAYVSISPEDVDLIYADKIQLGQFVYVGGLDKGSPVPVIRGLKSLPKRRPCIGTPTDLVPSDVLPTRPSVHFSKDKKTKKGSNFKIKRDGFDGSNKLRAINKGLGRLSLDSARRVWDQTPSTPRNSSAQLPSSRLKTKQVVADRKASPRNDPSSKRPSLSISPLKNKNDNVSSKLVEKSSRNSARSLSDETIPSHLVKVPLNSKSWSDQRISWDALPLTIKDLGKEAVSHRNVSFLAAVQALEEASCSEAIINCLHNPEKAGISLGEKYHYLIIENDPSKLISENNPPQSKQSPQSHYSSGPDSDATHRSSQSLKKHNSSANKMYFGKDTLSGESGLKEAANLAEKLLTVSCQWFFKYLESSLDKRFGLSGREGSTDIASLLGQLKRVNSWLDDLVGSGMQADEKIEGIRKKLYEFLLANVDSAIAGK
ncbi:uncharacterized protein LOC110808899 isoform X2 [Carica papaya]|uniref:uncharacterized protein LOC110808899 isoform X2 n=1 Tax=Carica papaya TaxID=3649 RepID=UPI000B8CE776|nr:uncharacterized protein LOC110808899 isoform X2 [Carica papaya]